MHSASLTSDTNKSINHLENDHACKQHACVYATSDGGLITSYSVARATSFHARVNSPLTSVLAIPILSPITWKTSHTTSSNCHLTILSYYVPRLTVTYLGLPKFSTVQITFYIRFSHPPVQQNYNFRNRPHNRRLPERSSRLVDCNFIIRMLYHDMY